MTQAVAEFGIRDQVCERQVAKDRQRQRPIDFVSDFIELQACVIVVDLEVHVTRRIEIARESHRFEIRFDFSSYFVYSDPER